MHAEHYRLLKRRQIYGSRACAEATAFPLRRVVETFEVGDVSKLMDHVQQIGERLVTAAPKELVVGNIVRRVLGLIREEAEEDREARSRSHDETTPEAHPHGTKSAPLREVINGPMPGLNIEATGRERASNSMADGRSVFG